MWNTGQHRKKGGCLLSPFFYGFVGIVVLVATLLSGCGVDEPNPTPNNVTQQAPAMTVTNLTNQQKLKVGDWEIQFGCFGTTGVYQSIYGSYMQTIVSEDVHCPKQ